MTTATIAAATPIAAREGEDDGLLGEAVLIDAIPPPDAERLEREPSIRPSRERRARSVRKIEVGDSRDERRLVNSATECGDRGKNTIRRRYDVEAHQEGVSDS